MKCYKRAAMKLPNLYIILVVMLIMNLPMAAKSDGIVNHDLGCPAQAYNAKTLREYSVTYSSKASVALPQSVIVDAHTALAAYWQKQITDSARIHVEVADLPINGITARHAILAAISGAQMKTLD